MNRVDEVILLRRKVAILEAELEGLKLVLEATIKKRDLELSGQTDIEEYLEKSSEPPEDSL